MTTKFNFFKPLKKGLRNPTIRNIIIVGVATLFIRAISFTKEIVVADSIGLTELLDTFFIAILIPSFISNVFMGAYKSVFIPNYVSELKTGNRIGSFQTTSYLVTLGISIFFCLVAYLFTDVYLEVFFKGHTENYYTLIKTQFYFVFPCIFFWGFSSLLNGLLTIADEFIFSSISTIFTPITVIICIIFFKQELGTLVLAIGTLIGSVLNFVFLFIVAQSRRLILINKPDFKSSNILQLFKQLPAKLSSGIINGMNPLVDQYFSAQLVIGSIAALNYGIKIPMFIIGIVGLALGNVLLPYFSKKALKNPAKTFKELKRIIKFLILGSSVIMIFLILLSAPIIELVFERNAFTSQDTTVVTKIQQMYLLQIPSYLIGVIMVKFLTSINRNTFMVFSSLVSLILNIVLNYILIRKMGVHGLALATSLVSIINAVILYVYINHLNKAHV